MSDTNSERVDAIVKAALTRSGAARSAFLDEACGEDRELRAAVERRLRELELQRDAPTEPFSAVHDRGPEPDATRTIEPGAAPSSDEAFLERNLLVGLVAVQMDFLSVEALADALRHWSKQRETPLEEFLVATGRLDGGLRELLRELVQRHIEAHGGSASESLQSLSSVDDVAAQLSRIDDPGIQESVRLLQIRSSQRISRSAAPPRTARTDASGRFRVLRRYRQGGLGTVHVALDSELQREVALKEVRERYADSSEARLRLRVEAEITGNLEHPGVVPVYGAGTYQDGRPFYCMRFIRGDSLKEAIIQFHSVADTLSPRDRNLELRNLLRRFTDVCDAIAYAHSRGVLHRDLKPGNIMLGRYGETLVVDWGVAKALGHVESEVEQSVGPVQPPSGDTPAPTQSGSTVGTPEYMSPEQAAGQLEVLGPATDIFSLGATLYCLLTGQPPYRGESNDTVLYKARRGDYPRPRTIDPRIPRALEAICMKAMARAPEDRYRSPLDLSRDIECWLADEPVSAYREPRLAQVGRTLRKNRTATITATAVLLTLMVGLIVLNAVTQQKNAVIAKQNNELRSSRAQLDENYRRFRQLTSRFMQRAENRFSQDPNMSRVRDWITQETLTTFREYLEPDAEVAMVGTDDDSQLWLVQLYRYDAHLKRRQGQVDEALAQYRRAKQIIDKLAKKRPADATIRDRRAELLRDYATTLRQKGAVQEGARLLEESLRVSDALRREFPDDFRYQSTHATNLLDVAGIHARLGKTEQAADEAKQASELFATIVDAKQGTIRHEQLLMLSLLLHSKCLRTIDRADEAASSVAESLRRMATRDDPANVGNRHTYARARLEQARVRLAQGLPPEQVLEAADEAVAVWSKLASQFPTVPLYRRYLTDSRLVQAQALAIDQQWGKARELLEQALGDIDRVLTAAPDDVDAMRIRGEILLMLSQVAGEQGNADESRGFAHEARVQLESVHELTPDSPRVNQLLDRARTQEGL